jgi:hypothetical protein
MQAYGYRLAGNAHTASADYIPSLIGVKPDQTEPGPDDTYYEAYDLPAEALNITAAALTRWVSYDSLPSSERDPIIGVKAGPSISYYHTLSELVALLAETESLAALEIVNRLRLVSNHG